METKTEIIHDGVTFTYKSQHGGWFADPEWEEIGTLAMPANADGSPALDDVGEIEWSYYDAGGICVDACALCCANALLDELAGERDDDE